MGKQHSAKMKAGSRCRDLINLTALSLPSSYPARGRTGSRLQHKLIRNIIPR